MLARKSLFKRKVVGMHMATILVSGGSGMLGQHLGWSPKTEFKEALEHTYDYLLRSLKQGSHQR